MNIYSTEKYINIDWKIKISRFKLDYQFFFSLLFSREDGHTIASLAAIWSDGFSQRELGAFIQSEGIKTVEIWQLCAWVAYLLIINHNQVDSKLESSIWILRSAIVIANA